jgi:hypothetical protein
MKNAFILAVGLSLVGTAAWSQSSSREDYDSPHHDYTSARDGHGRFDRWHNGDDSWERSSDDDRGDRMRGDDGPGRGARFFLKHGDAQIRIVCGTRESTEACVNAALRLFDRVQTLSRTNPSSSSGPSTPPPAAQ